MQYINWYLQFECIKYYNTQHFLLQNFYKQKFLANKSHKPPSLWCSRLIMKINLFVLLTRVMQVSKNVLNKFILQKTKVAPMVDIYTECLNGVFQQKSNSNVHLHHPSPYKNTKKVSNKVKYLLTTLMQDKKRERK